MKTPSLITKTLLALCGLAIAYFLLHAKFATYTEPKDVLSALDLDLSTYQITSSDNNLDRGSSRWDWYSYEISFPLDDTTKILKQLESNGWEYNSKNGSYWKSQEVDGDLTYSSSVYPKEGKARLQVDIDEMYRARDIFMAFFIAIIFILIGIIYLIVKKL